MKKLIFLVLALSLAFSLTLDEYIYNHLYDNETYKVEETPYNLRYYYIIVVDDNFSKSFVVDYEGDFHIVENASLIANILQNYYSSKINSSEMEEFRNKLLTKIDAFDKSRESEKECVEYFNHCSSLESCKGAAMYKNQSESYAEAIFNLTSNSKRVDELIEPFAYTPEDFEQMLSAVIEVNILSQRNTKNPLVLDGVCEPFEYNTSALIEAREMLEEKKTIMEGFNRINETSEEMAEQGEKRGLIPPKISEEKKEIKKAEFEIKGYLFKDEGITITFRSGVERIPDEKITIIYPSGKKMVMRTDYAGEIKIKLSEPGTYFLEPENYALEQNSFEVGVKEAQNYDIVIYALIGFLIVAYLVYRFILAPRKTSSS